MLERGRVCHELAVRVGSGGLSSVGTRLRIDGLRAHCRQFGAGRRRSHGHGLCCRPYCRCPGDCGGAGGVESRCLVLVGAEGGEEAAEQGRSLRWHTAEPTTARRGDGPMASRYGGRRSSLVVDFVVVVLSQSLLWVTTTTLCSTSSSTVVGSSVAAANPRLHEGQLPVLSDSAPISPAVTRGR